MLGRLESGHADVIMDDVMLIHITILFDEILHDVSPSNCIYIYSALVNDSSDSSCLKETRAEVELFQTDRIALNDNQFVKHQQLYNRV